MAFDECKSLTEIMIGGGGLTLKKTGPKLLRYSQTIKTVEFPSTLKVVDCHAFKCDQISTIRSRSVTPAQLMWSNPAFMGGMMDGKSTDPFPNKCTFMSRRQTFPFSLGRCHAVTEGYETARP